MEKVFNTEIQARLEAYIAAGNSQEKTAKQVGFTGGLLSSYRNSSYKGSVANVEKALAEFFRVLDAGHEQRGTEILYCNRKVYVPTSISEKIYSTIRYCQLEKGMVTIYGDAGVGKTMAAEKYAQDNPALAIYLRVSPSTGSLGSFLRVLSNALHISDRRSNDHLILSIRERLDGTNRVLIIDEAQHLQLRTIDEIRTLGDPSQITGNDGIGIVLIGNDKVYTRMLGKQEAEFAQLFSRSLFNLEVRTHNVTKQDVEKVFTMLTGEDKAKELTFINGVCQSRWGIRGAVNLYNNAANNEDTSYNGLLGMARNMGIGLI